MSPHHDPTVVKATVGAVGALVLSIGAWGYTWAAQALETDTFVDVLLPGSALTACAGALMWLVRLMASGQLVHRDTAEATAKLARALEQSNHIAERALDREEILTDLLTQRRNP
ncbi:MAG: hypothetical protein AAGE88_18130 [Actinomycetota bacterium]